MDSNKTLNSQTKKGKIKNEITGKVLVYSGQNLKVKISFQIIFFVNFPKFPSKQKSSIIQKKTSKLDFKAIKSF